MSSHRCICTHICLVDAAYEGVQKCTYLAMAIMMLLLLPVLVILILLYPKLGKLRDQQIEDFTTDSEMSQLMPDEEPDMPN